MSPSIDDRVNVAVDAWLRWLPSWRPGTHRGRVRLCRRCTGSPFLAAAGLTGDVPHLVTHALVSRLQRIIDREVDHYTEQNLPVLHAELTGEELWKAGGFDPGQDLPPEYEDIDPDPEPEPGEQPTLFTFAELAEDTRPEPPLPRPPLTQGEKQQLRREIELADRHADGTGRAVCLSLVGHRQRIVSAVERFVEPQIRELLEELSRGLEAPGLGG